MCKNPDHIAPLTALTRVLLNEVLYWIVWACRAGSKTYLFGGLDSWYKSCVNKRLETKILGGSEAQSTLSYSAMDSFWKIVGIEMEKEFLTRAMLKQSAEYRNGSSVSILTASSKSVRGPHPQILKLDEVDEIEEQVFEDAGSQPLSKYGHKASLCMFSTNHHMQGTMDKALKSAEESDTAIFRYCIWECLESCRDFSCSTCKLSAICPGIQMKEADGYYKIEDFVRKLGMLSWSTVQIDWLCTKVGKGDLIYQNEWNEKVHVVNVGLDMNKPVILSIDWGGVSPFSIGVWQKAPKWLGDESWVRVTELYLTSMQQSATNKKLIELAKQRPWWKLVKEVIPDNSRPDLIQEWREALPSDTAFLIVEKNVDAMIEMVKDALSPVLGVPKIFVNIGCVNIQREVTLYRINKKTEKPIDENNHTLDETGYFVMAKIGKPGETYFSVIQKDVRPR